MVWFQCEACGEELKKPKLPNHFRQCSAYKLSCIDCGETFDQQSVQAHTQCITEAEKYGPKGVAKPGGGAKPNKEKQKPDVDTSVGLSQRPPWFCSLCNTQATSQQALLIHADGKKHRAKCRAYAAKLNPVANNHTTQTNISSVSENGNLPLNKRKHDTPINTTDATVTQPEEVTRKPKKAKQQLELKPTENQKQIKWKKLIASLLKSTPDGTLKMNKLQKLVFKSLQESGIVVNDSDFRTTLEHKVNSSSKYKVDGKYVRLAA